MDKDKLQLFQNKILSHIIQKLQDVNYRIWKIEKSTYTHFYDIFIVLDVGFPIVLNVKITDTYVYIETKVSEDFREPTSEQIIIDFEKNTTTHEQELNTVIDIINNLFDQAKSYQNKK